MNITNQQISNKCTSCGVCASVCPKRAISMYLDSEGFYRPTVDMTLCNNCGLCTIVCYKFDEAVRMTSKEDLKQKPLYSAWAIDNNVVKGTTSGGIGDILAHRLLKEGYKVVGVVYNESKTRAEHKVAQSTDDLIRFRGSKYIQSYTFDAFKEIVANCRNKKYAVFGVPCQIYALHKMASQRGIRDNFFFVDLFCHGCPSLYVWTKYQDKIKRRRGVDRLDGVSFRSKIRGWGNFYVVTLIKGKPVLINKINDKFYELFFCDQLLNEACQNCKLRSTLEYTDIRLGDFWGKKYLNNIKGVSAVSIVTNRGQNVFNSLKDEIVFETCEYPDFLPWQSWNKSYIVNAGIRKAVLDSLSSPQKTIDDAIWILRSMQPVSNNVKRLVKCFISVFPLHIVNSLKYIKFTLFK